MVAIIFPFTMELLVVVLFGLVALPVYVVKRILEALDDAMG
jgi:hypothetical protein